MPEVVQTGVGIYNMIAHATQEYENLRDGMDELEDSGGLAYQTLKAAADEKYKELIELRNRKWARYVE